jgi:hypothetical protein
VIFRINSGQSFGCCAISRAVQFAPPERIVSTLNPAYSVSSFITQLVPFSESSGHRLHTAQKRDSYQHILKRDQLSLAPDRPFHSHVPISANIDAS